VITRGDGAARQVEQQTSDREMAEIVRSELHLEAVDSHLARGDAHDPGVVDQQIDRPTVNLSGGGERRHRPEVGQIERFADNNRRRRHSADRFGRCLALLGAARCKDHFGAGKRERLRRLEADAAVRSGHDREAVRKDRDVLRCPRLRSQVMLLF
jgi:hypothetical protein